MFYDSKGVYHVMQSKKVITFILSFLLAVGCIVGILFAACSIFINLQQNAAQDISKTSSEALSVYEDALIEKSSECVQETQSESNSNKSEDFTEMTSNHTPEADTPTNLPDYIVQDKDGTYVYMIQHGDTLSQISAKLLYSVDELAEYNFIRDVNLIYADSALRIPQKSEEQ